MKLHTVPTRAVTGAFILHSGLDKWRAEEAVATRTHGFAVGAFPFLNKLSAKQFLRVLGAGEMALGGALLAPFVPDRLAGVGLTAFSGSLMALYARTPGMRKPGSVWPTPPGIAMSKDVWMVGIGLGLMLDG
jgi:hypothetical protein